MHGLSMIGFVRLEQRFNVDLTLYAIIRYHHVTTDHEGHLLALAGVLLLLLVLKELIGRLVDQRTHGLRVDNHTGVLRQLTFLALPHALELVQVEAD